METYVLQVKREIPDPGCNQIVNLISASVADHHILPDNEDKVFHSIPLKIKSELKEEFEMSPSQNIGPSAGDLLTPLAMKLEPLDLKSSSATFQKPLEMLEPEMIFEDHGTTYPKDSCDVQQNMSSNEPHGLKVEFPSFQGTMAEEINFIEHQLKKEKYTFLKDTNYRMSRALEKENLSVYDKQIGGCRETRHNKSKVKSLNLNQYCLHCDKIFSCLEDLRKHHLIHERVHIINKDCQLDSNTENKINYSSRNSIKLEKTRGVVNDVDTHSGEKDYGSEFDDHLQTNKRVQKAHDKTIHCEKKFYQKNNLNLSNLGDKHHLCNQCGKAFKKKYNLKLHLQTHTGIRPYKCNTCGKSYLKKDYLKTHITMHSGIKSHKCSICEKTFLRVDYLKRHLMVHQEEKAHKCNQCEKAFRQKSELTKHFLMHTGEKRHYCSQCERTFKDKGHLNKHMMSHTGERPHKCSQCDKTYTSRYQLNIHSFCHSDEKPHLCKQCGLTFGIASTLKAHILLHAEGKPHECSQCEKAFVLASQLERHMIAHSTERPHPCSKCKKTFKLKADLKNHMFLHSGKKPYSCNQCSKAFPRKHALKLHALIHTGEKNYLCPECGKLFRTLNNLKCHILTHHGKKNTKLPLI